MTEMDNFSTINENFDTIKTLLNSIRAQGILNTSDVDKLLSGINTKLEKINTDEDIDLIKIFLSELKQNLDERHGVLVAKFGAIESLFSNLLKNSAELPKSSDIKELFDIVATNLSVFSREVVSQKESLTEISLRLEALRSDDSQKKDIIKNITLLKPDLERLNNGFDSIVINLNENFKTIAKTIATIDKSEQFDKFSNILNNIEISSNTILSALQVIDKKNEKIDDVLSDLVRKEDLLASNKQLIELNAQNQEIFNTLSDVSRKQIKIDNLSEKIDASVNIIAGLKSAIEETETKLSENVLEQLKALELQLQDISSDNKFEEFKTSLEITLNNILEKCTSLDQERVSSSQNFQNIIELIQALNINVNFQNLFGSVDQLKEDIKASIQDVSQKLISLQDVNATRVVNDFTSGMESLSSKLGQTQSAIAMLCEKNFSSVFESVLDLKKLLAQIDENSVSANNAIFSNISDRLVIFENELSATFKNQEKFLNDSTIKIVGQIEDIKNVSSVLDYKMDSTILETTNAKKDFTALKSSIEELLALNFVNVVKDLRADLYASKQEIATSFEKSNNDLAENLSNDLYAKYELLVSKLDAVENNFKQVQATSLQDLKSILEKISNSTVDIISYVSEINKNKNEDLEDKISELFTAINSNNLNYIENVRDIVDVIKIQVDDNLKLFEEENFKHVESLKETFIENSDEIRKEIKYSYSKLLEIQDSYSEIKNFLNDYDIKSSDKLKDLLQYNEDLNLNLENKLANLKLALLDKVSEFKQEFTCENADKISELNFALENYSSQNTQNINELLENLKIQIKNLNEVENQHKQDILKDILENFKNLKDLLNSANISNQDMLSQEFKQIDNSLSEFKTALENVDYRIDRDLTQQMSIIESDFESLVSQITILFDKSDKSLSEKIDEKFSSISEVIQDQIAYKLEDYKLLIENAVDNLGSKSLEQAKNIQENFSKFNTTFNEIIEEQFEESSKHIDDMIASLKTVIDENVKLTAVDYVALKNKLNEFAKNIENNTQNLEQNFKVEFSNLNSELNILFENNKEILLELSNKNQASMENNAENIVQKIDSLTTSINESLSSIDENNKNISKEISEKHQSILENKSIEIVNKIENLSSSLSENLTSMREENKNLTKEVSEANNLLIQNNSDTLVEKIDSLSSSLNESKETINLVSKNTTNLLQKNNDQDAKINELQQVSITQHQEVEKSIALNKSLLEEIDSNLSKNVEIITSLINQSSSEELQTISSHIDQIENNLELQKEQINSYKDSLITLFKNEINTINTSVEKETDVIISEFIDQFELLKRLLSDVVVNTTTQVDDIVNAHIYSNIEDLKSYLDVKTDNSIINDKLDNLKNEFRISIQEMTDYLNKLLVSDAFITSIADYRTANELFITTTVDKLNSKIENLFTNTNNTITDSFSLFDKKFIDTLVDKYEELKLISSKYNDSFTTIESSITGIIYEFKNAQKDLNDSIKTLSQIIESNNDASNKQIESLQKEFNELRTQILNKPFGEEIKTSINNQLTELEDLINNQFTYIKDINELCSINLPDLTELNTLVKNSILASLKDFSEKLDSYNVEHQLNNIKTDVITQMLNIFNQISFVAEEEEILDFIQEKHDELIIVLSHLVTSSEDITTIKENVNNVDLKIDSLREDISSINDKISQIISAGEDVDYIYSLHEIETDIAGLRIALNDIKQGTDNKELTELVNSTNEIYTLVEAIKAEITNNTKFATFAEDIESLSTRTNKLILTSDESYKLLQDNLQDFKLVINDIDDRTRNFSQETGLDKINSKMNAINSMLQEGAKSNQVFTKIFEYLAEWIDNAGNQIDSISNKVGQLEDINQIKSMLEDIKKGSEDNSDTIELVESLGDIFGKQVKRISSIESKLDRIIVDSTLNNQSAKNGTKSMEDILNRFLVVMDEKMNNQQAKINLLEEKLAEVMVLLDEKNTAQLSKKVGGMDRQIAKLNKSIEKIASHVIEN